MPSRYHHLDDDRDLTPAPASIEPCDQCGAAVRVHPDDLADTPHRCVPCLRATVRAFQARPMPDDDVPVWF